MCVSNTIVVRGDGGRGDGGVSVGLGVKGVKRTGLALELVGNVRGDRKLCPLRVRLRKFCTPRRKFCSLGAGAGVGSLRVRLSIRCSRVLRSSRSTTGVEF